MGQGSLSQLVRKTEHVHTHMVEANNVWTHTSISPHDFKALHFRTGRIFYFRELLVEIQKQLNIPVRKKNLPHTVYRVFQI
jgi:hypothetical protein